VFVVARSQVTRDEQVENLLTSALQLFGSLSAAPSSAAEASAEWLLWVTRAASMRKNLPFGASACVPKLSTASATWQEYLCELVLERLSLAVMEEGVTNERALQVALASKMHILTSEESVVLSGAVHRHACAAALFWKQKLWNRLFTKLAPTSTPVADLAPIPVLAVCSLLQGVPQSVLQDGLPRVVEIVVTGLRLELESTTQSPEPVLPTSAMAVQVMAALQLLLTWDAQLFAPYLNVVVPAVLKVSSFAPVDLNASVSFACRNSTYCEFEFCYVPVHTDGLSTYNSCTRAVLLIFGILTALLRCGLTIHRRPLTRLWPGSAPLRWRV
jgi:hypothetical protein